MARVQVVSGISEAQTSQVVSGTSAQIVPTDSSKSLEEVIYREIEFDVAVSTSEGTKTKGGVGVFVGPVGLGSAGRSESASAYVNRIKFSVPVFLPLHARFRVAGG